MGEIKEARPLFRAISPVLMARTIQNNGLWSSQGSILLRKWNKH
jgi:hypothetical protein